MAIRSFLAMTAAEFTAAETLPDHIAWMACHFSPYGTGLTNLPATLPPDSLLMLNDRIPICGHDPERICRQLIRAVEQFQCSGIVLDFQRTAEPGIPELIDCLMDRIPCPIAVSDPYAKDPDCPVFLSPCPHHVPLSEYILPWQGRNIWLDLASNAETILLTKERSQITPLPLGELPEKGHWDSLLHCHYSIDTRLDSARFTLWRTKEDLTALAQEAEILGIQTLIGLFLECNEKI